jgi:phosphatidylethanolamine/phosphatidyl-N-methylethanolamine N-methyltransferase
MRLRTNLAFLESVARDFKRTGAVAPSSSSLAAAMTSELAATRHGAVRVLEVGGGTGSITRAIVRHLSPQDHLDVYEIDPKFALLIRSLVHEDKAFRSAKSQIQVHNEPIESIKPVRAYDFVISGLPFTNFEPEKVREILEIFRSVLKPGGICTFFDYILGREAAKIVSGNLAGRERVEGVGRIVLDYINRYEFRHEIVFRNLPPATAHHIRFTD